MFWTIVAAVLLTIIVYKVVKHYVYKRFNDPVAKARRIIEKRPY